MRKRIYEIIEVAKPNDKVSLIYDRVVLAFIVLSIIPLGSKEFETFSIWIDRITVVVLIVDYLLRWITADIKYPKSGAVAFFYYPLTFYAIIDLMALLPSFTALNNSFKLLRLFRLSRIFIALKLLRYSKNLELFLSILKKQRQCLLTVFYLAVEYILLSALIIFAVEPESFETFFDAIYWAVVTLTTVGYGDIYPVSYIGRIISMLSSFIGIAIIALPTGIITVGYMEELRASHSDDDSHSS
ncbi:MAG: potassium channel family protein [Oscillospiraceae bacterium]|jgi:voltage-gated potassium channel